MRTPFNTGVGICLILVLLLMPAAPVTAQPSDQANGSVVRPSFEKTDEDISASNQQPISEAMEILAASPIPTTPTTDDDVKESPDIVEGASLIQVGWQTIMSENAEGAFPSGNGWVVGDDNIDSGDDYWDDLNCNVYEGGWSIWAADVGDMADCDQYDNDMRAWMIYGPFDLSGDVTDASLDFYYSLDSELGFDYFKWLASSDGTDFIGFQSSGNSGGWTDMSFDLSTYVGDSSVWIAFLFESNSTTSAYEGAYVDNIILSKYVAGVMEPDIDVDPSSMSFTRESTPTSVQASAGRLLDYSHLQAKAQDEGQLPVIIRLKTDFVPEGRMSRPTATGEQRSTIEEAQDEVLSSLSNQVVNSVKRFQYSPYLALEVDAEGLEILKSSPTVEDIIEDVAEPPTLNVSIPLINADDAWGAGHTGNGQVVAILDSGVASSHPFLNGKVVSEACYSSDTTVSATFCPNGQEIQTGIGAGTACDTDIASCKHGTHVAGIAAGAEAAFAGVARDADIIAIQVFSRFEACSSYGQSSPCALSYVSDQMLGLERVYELRNSHSIAAVNMSLGGAAYASVCDSDPRKAAIDNLRSVDIATVIASGNGSNSGAISTPACISSAISVGATTSQTPADQVASYSNSAGSLDLLAPGSNINSSVPGGGFESWSGTSMAAPHTAGAWAVLKSQRPNATVDEILDALTTTGVSILDARNGLTFPRIDVNAALSAPQFDEFLEINNLGNSDLAISGISVVGAECDWLVLTPPATSFSIPPADSETVGVMIDLCVGPGTYQKTIRINSNDPDESTVDVPVTLVVSGSVLADLAGTFTLQGRTDQSVALTVDLYTVGAGTPSYQFTPTSTSAGAFTVSGITPGIYEIAVKHSNSLQAVETATLSEGANDVAFDQLSTGDANDDNLVSALDFSILTASYNKADGDADYDGRADFNGDNLVSAIDFSLLSDNYNTAGEAPSGSP